MFLFERLVGIGIFGIILFIMCIFIYCKDSNYKLILFLYTIILAVMGFFYIPYETADIYRIYEFLDAFEHMSFSNLFSDYSKSSSVGGYIYYWIFAQIGEFRLLPAVTAVIVYSCVFYIIVRTAEKYDIKRKYIILALVFIMATDSFMHTIAGIRSMLSMSLVAFCFFRETVEKKFNIFHVILYFLAAIIHNFAVVIIIIRLFIPVFDKRLSLTKKFVYILCVAIFGIFAMKNMGSIFEGVFEKANSYISDGEYSYVWGYVIAILIGIILIFTLFNTQNRNFNQFAHMSQAKIILMLILMLSVIFCFEYTILSRLLTHCVPVIFIPYLMFFLNKNEGSKYNLCVSFLCFVTLAIVFVRGDLCSFKVFVLD